MNCPDKWDARFLGLAEFISEWSKDPSTKVGAVIVLGRKVISVGYNGFPAGVDDTQFRLNERELKYKLTVHGEINAIVTAGKSVWGSTLYTTPFMPCSSCAGIVIQSGIKRVVSYTNDNPRWQESFALTEMMFKEAGVRLDLYNKDGNEEETLPNRLAKKPSSPCCGELNQKLLKLGSI